MTAFNDLIARLKAEQQAELDAMTPIQRAVAESQIAAAKAEMDRFEEQVLRGDGGT